MEQQPVQEIKRWPQFKLKKTEGLEIPIILSIAHFWEHIYGYVLPPLFPILKEQFGLTYTQLGFLGTARNMVNGILQAPAGMMADRIGHYKVLFYSFIGISVACILLGLAPSFYWLILAQIISGVVSSAFHPSSYAVIMDSAHQNKRGFSVALHTLGGNTGNIVVFTLMSFLSIYLGWRGALLALSIPGFVIAYILYATFKKLNLSQQNEEEQPQTKTQGGKMQSKKLHAIIIMTLVSTLLGMYGRALPIFLPLFFTDIYSSSLVFAGFSSSVFFIGGFIGTVAGGILSDKYDDKVNLIFIACVITGITTLALTMLELSTTMMVIMVGILGIIRVLGHPARTVLAATILPKEQAGFMLGLVYGGTFLGGTIMTIILGFMSDLFGLSSAFFILGVVSCITALMCLVLKRYV